MADAQEQEYEFEDPGQAWVALVEACHLAEVKDRRQAVQELIFEAKNSHWTMVLWEAEQEVTQDDTTEYGGPFEQQDWPHQPGSDYVEQGSAPGPQKRKRPDQPEPNPYCDKCKKACTCGLVEL